MRLLRRSFWVAVFVAALVVGWRFAARNGGTVAVDYLLGVTPEVTLWAALLAAFLAGAGCAGAVSFLKLAQLRLATRRYRKAVRGLEAEVHQLRNLPLAPPAADEAAAERGA